MHAGSPTSDHDQQQRLIQAFIAGKDRADEDLFAWLRPTVDNAVAPFQTVCQQDCEDVAQETIMAVFGYLRRRGAFDGNLPGFAVTIARNRCRDILRFRRRHPHRPLESLTAWLADDRKSALDHLTEREVSGLVRQAVAVLRPDCRFLIQAVYFLGETMENLRQELKLKSVQAVYYRRDACLRQMLKVLKNRLSDRSLFGG